MQRLSWNISKIYIEADLEEGARAPFFCNHLFFCDHFEELHIVFIELKVIINNAPLTYFTKYYQNITLKSFAVWQTVIMLF